MADPVLTLVTYRPHPGKEAELEALIRKHGPTLRATGLITDRPVEVWRAFDKETGKPYFVEMLQWKSEEASDVAHQTPEIMAVWEPMGPILEDLGLARLEPLLRTP